MIFIQYQFPISFEMIHLPIIFHSQTGFENFLNVYLNTLLKRFNRSLK